MHYNICIINNAFLSVWIPLVLINNQHYQLLLDSNYTYNQALVSIFELN